MGAEGQEGAIRDATDTSQMFGDYIDWRAEHPSDDLMTDLLTAEFEDESLKIGTVKLKDRTLVCVFNWGNTPATIPVKFAKAGEVTDLWSSQAYGKQSALDLPLKPHEGTVLVVR